MAHVGQEGSLGSAGFLGCVQGVGKGSLLILQLLLQRDPLIQFLLFAPKFRIRSLFLQHQGQVLPVLH